MTTKQLVLGFGLAMQSLQATVLLFYATDSALIGCADKRHYIGPHGPIKLTDTRTGKMSYLDKPYLDIQKKMYGVKNILLGFTGDTVAIMTGGQKAYDMEEFLIQYFNKPGPHPIDSRLNDALIVYIESAANKYPAAVTSGTGKDYFKLSLVVAQVKNKRPSMYIVNLHYQAGKRPKTVTEKISPEDFIRRRIIYFGSGGDLIRMLLNPADQRFRALREDPLIMKAAEGRIASSTHQEVADLSLRLIRAISITLKRLGYNESVSPTADCSFIPLQ